MRVENLLIGLITTSLVSCSEHSVDYSDKKKIQIEAVPQDTIIVDNLILSEDSIHIFFESGYDSTQVRILTADFAKEKVLKTDPSLGVAARISVPITDRPIQILVDDSHEFDLNPKGRRNIIVISLENDTAKVGFKEEAPIYY